MSKFAIIILIGLLAYWAIRYIYNEIKRTVRVVFNKRRTRVSDRELQDFIKNQQMRMMNTIDIKDFYKEKQYLIQKGFNEAGVYIFKNLDNNMKYVGQSVNVVNRVETHLKGRGNEDLYRDIKNNHRFLIEFIKLEDSNFYNLDELEKYYIAKYNSFISGYNKTRGNS